MTIDVYSCGLLVFKSRVFRCALGRGGLKVGKREGDGATPVGNFSLREVLYRADRFPRPQTRLRCNKIGKYDGWCDDPQDPSYNRKIRRPYPAHNETLFRQDRLYDIVIPIGYNDNPPVAGLGSAIFLHVAKNNYGNTDGCLALSPPDLLTVIESCQPECKIRINPPR